jgi:hypothetical protein
LGHEVYACNQENYGNKNIRQLHHSPLFPPRIERRVVASQRNPLPWA